MILSDVRLYRQGLAQALSIYEQIEVAGTCSTDGPSLERLRELQPQVVLLELAERESLALVSAIGEASPETRVVAFAVAEVEAEVLACAEAGVCGYVPREGSLDDMVAVVESVAREELLCSPHMAAKLFRRLASLAARGRDVLPDRVCLTVRERQIVGLLDRGLSNKEIAGCLNIEVATVKNHVHNILEKLRVTSRGEAAALVRGLPPTRRRGL